MKRLKIIWTIPGNWEEKMFLDWDYTENFSWKKIKNWIQQNLNFKVSDLGIYIYIYIYILFLNQKL